MTIRAQHCYRKLDIDPPSLRNSFIKDRAVEKALREAKEKHGLNLEYGNAEYIDGGVVWARFIVRKSK